MLKCHVTRRCRVKTCCLFHQSISTSKYSSYTQVI